jgi:hypothetical protein
MAISYRGIAIEIRKHTDPRNGQSRGEYWFKCQGVARHASTMRATVSQIDDLLDDELAKPASTVATCYGV